MKCLTHLPNVNFDHRVAMHYQWWSIDQKILILWKLISIGTKLSNDIACNLNLNLIENKLGANWERRYWKYVHEYGVGKKKLLKIHTCKATPFHPSLLGNGINIF